MAAVFLLAAVPAISGDKTPGRFTIVAGRYSPAERQPVTLVRSLKTAPFPYKGFFGDTGTDFFDYVDPDTGERFHTNSLGNRYSEKGHYSDSSVLFYIPANFDPGAPFRYLVFFHGHETKVEDFFIEHRLDIQIEDSRANVILICPQLALRAIDSSPGKFFEDLAFKDFMDEAAAVLAEELGFEYSTALSLAPVIPAAFSGGYKAAAMVLDRGGVDGRIDGVFLVDALYDDLSIFLSWILETRENDTFFISMHTTGSTEEQVDKLAEELEVFNVRYGRHWPRNGEGRGIFLIKSPNTHEEVLRKGPPLNPVSKMLRVTEH